MHRSECSGWGLAGKAQRVIKMGILGGVGAVTDGVYMWLDRTYVMPDERDWNGKMEQTEPTDHLFETLKNRMNSMPDEHERCWQAIHSPG